MNKPSWMNRETWVAFLQKYEGHPRCAVCGVDGTEHVLCVDHVVPRAECGTDEISNLQCLCGLHNLQKSSRPDRYWAGHFYFDNEHDPSRLRTAQRIGAYERAQEYREWFLRPWSQISGVLYVMSWIVGAGKTLGIPALAFSLNRLVRMHGAAGTPRIDRVLVLTKEQAVRDQVAAALRAEIVEHGICAEPPRVAVAKDSSVWANLAMLQSADIWVACIQSLWRNDNRAIPNLEAALARFPLIVIDEPHFAEEQVMYLVERGIQSLFFGTTGSPIKASGATISRFVRFSEYTYHDAVENDGSMKWLASDEETWPLIVDSIGTAGSTIMDPGGSLRETESTDEPGYEKAIVAAKSVAERVVHYVKEQDETHSVTGAFVAAPHRPAAAEARLVYPIHAMIRVDSRATARTIAKTLNEMFDRDRARFPREHGYAADWVCSDGRGENGEMQPGRPLTPDHEWMLAKNHGGALVVREKGHVRHSVRFLIVVGVGREGVNNPYCGVVGVGCRLGSLVEGVQRVFGRQLRALVSQANERLVVPPSRLDTVRVVLHRAHRNEDVVRRAALFLLNMPDYLDGMITMDELVAGDVLPAAAVVEEDGAITSGEKLALIAAVGEARLSGTQVDHERLARSLAYGSEKRERAVAEFVRRVQQEPEQVARDLRHFETIAPIPVVMRETPTAEVTDDALTRFARTRGAGIAAKLARLDDADVRELITGWYLDHVAHFHTGGLRPSTAIETIRKAYVQDVLRDLGAAYVGDRQEVHRLVGRAVKRVFDVPEDRSASNGSEWDTAQCHAILLRGDVRRIIQGYVRHHLVLLGLCPTIAAALHSTSRRAA